MCLLMLLTVLLSVLFKFQKSKHGNRSLLIIIPTLANERILRHINISIYSQISSGRNHSRLRQYKHLHQDEHLSLLVRVGHLQSSVPIVEVIRAVEYSRSDTAASVSTRNTTPTAIIASCSVAGLTKFEVWPSGGGSAGTIVVVVLEAILTVNQSRRNRPTSGKWKESQKE